MNFTLNRNKTVSSTLGHAIAFEKNVPTHVPPEMWPAVLAVGATPDEDLPETKVADTKEPALPQDREKAIFAGFEQMILKNAREDFTGTGLPHAKALEAQLGFRIENKERDILWQKFKTMDAE